MKKYLEKLPRDIRHLIAIAGEAAHSQNMPAYLVGGFVRDLILEVKNLDLDIVVEGDGIKFAEILSQKLGAGLVRHKRFGTATILISKHLKVDIATARSERYPKAAELPEVTCGILKDDLLRRDFTINAMAVSINREDFGRFIDCFDGKKDLAEKKIRVLHGLSFIDDPTRILRAIRFEQRYGFRIEPKTLGLLRQAKKLKMLEKVQPQRLRDELILMLKEEGPLKQLKRVNELAGFDFIKPGLSLSKKSLVFMKSIENQINWFNNKFSGHRQLESWVIYLIGLMEPLDISSIKLICRRYAFRRGEEIRLLTYKTIKPALIRELGSDKVKPSRIFRLLEPLSYEVIILIRAKFKSAKIRKHTEDFFGVYNGTRIHVSGEDLRGNGLEPGPFYQKIFHKVLDAKLDGVVKTKAEELELVKRITRKIKGVN
jgi:tRNA nucleotidyltransferase (CCA-adding enzyme)